MRLKFEVVIDADDRMTVGAMLDMLRAMRVEALRHDGAREVALPSLIGEVLRAVERDAAAGAKTG